MWSNPLSLINQTDYARVSGSHSYLAKKGSLGATIFNIYAIIKDIVIFK